MELPEMLDTFQVHIKLPELFTKRFVSYIPEQRRIVNELLEKRVILNYALSMDRAHLWITIQAKNELVVMDILETFPIIKDVKVEIFELAFFDTAHLGMPEIIMN